MIKYDIRLFSIKSVLENARFEFLTALNVSEEDHKYLLK
jgi:hypothetical protein